MAVKAGQVMWLKLPFGKTDDVSAIYHPYLILSIEKREITVVSVGQMDTSHGRYWEMAHRNTVPVDKDNPPESAIYAPSFLQTDRSIRIAYFDELALFLDTDVPLSEAKFNKVLNAYFSKRQKYGYDDFRDMFFTKEEILELNPFDDWEQTHIYRLKKYGLL